MGVHAYVGGAAGSTPSTGSIFKQGKLSLTLTLT